MFYDGVHVIHTIRILCHVIYFSLIFSHLFFSVHTPYSIYKKKKKHLLRYTQQFIKMHNQQYIISQKKEIITPPRFIYS